MMSLTPRADAIRAALPQIDAMHAAQGTSPEAALAARIGGQLMIDFMLRMAEAEDAGTAPVEVVSATIPLLANMIGSVVMNHAEPKDWEWFCSNYLGAVMAEVDSRFARVRAGDPSAGVKVQAEIVPTGQA